MSVRITNVQHFSTGDGPGIRTTVFFAGCSLRCPWCHNPETIPGKPVTLRYEATGRCETVGGEVDEKTVVDELLWDKDYYDESGGGVTLSGGEVLLQPDAAARIAEAMRENGVHVAIDTAGFASRESLMKLAPLADLWLYDVKSADAAKFAAVCGGELSVVVDNLRYLTESGANVRARVPLIPGFNDAGGDLEAIGDLIESVGCRAVDVLPFHRLGSAKYAAMGLDYAYKNTPPPEAGTLERARKIFARRFEVTIERH